MQDWVFRLGVKTGKNTEINKQFNVKLWLNSIKFGAVSYLLSCTYFCVLTEKTENSMVNEMVYYNSTILPTFTIVRGYGIVFITGIVGSKTDSTFFSPCQKIFY